MKEYVTKILLADFLHEGDSSITLTPQDFDESDITDFVSVHGKKHIKLEGLNGIVPYKWFNDESIKKIELYRRKIQSKLWKCLDHD